MALGYATSRSIAVSVEPGSRYDLFRARIDFSIVDPYKDWIALDLRLWPGNAIQVRTSLSGKTRFRDGVLSLPVTEGVTEGTLEVEFRWDHPTMGGITSLPHALPEFVYERNEPEAFDLPLLDIAWPIASRYDRLWWPYSEPVSSDVRRAEGAWVIATAVSEGHEIRKLGRTDLVIADPRDIGLSNEELETVVSGIESGLQVCAEVLRVEPPDRVLLASPTSIAAPLHGECPGVLSLTHTDPDQDLGDPFNLHFELGRQLASIWWGGTCRLLGEDGIASESAIRAAIGLCVAERVGTRKRLDDLLAYFDATGAPSVTKRLLDSLSNRPNFSHAGRLAARLSRLELGGDRILERLTRANWGKSSSVAAIHALVSET